MVKLLVVLIGQLCTKRHNTDKIWLWPIFCVKLNLRSCGFYEVLWQESVQAFHLHIHFLEQLGFCHLSLNSADMGSSHMLLE